jgi:hypothetical protein
MDAYSVSADASGNVNTKTCISQPRYSRYLTIITDRLKKDGLLDYSGNIKSGAEYLAALLICDLMQNGSITDYGIKSETYGKDYAYLRAENVTKSAFLTKYEYLLTQRNKGVYASSGTVREDYEIEFSKLSQGDLPRVYDSSSNYPTI